MSRTHQYRKVMKPLLERKRRARINHCLDDIKDLLVDSLQTESGESITKLEKADVLELTLKHLREVKRQKKVASANTSINGPNYTSNEIMKQHFNNGYKACAAEVSRYLDSTTLPNSSSILPSYVDSNHLSTSGDQFGRTLMVHLGKNLQLIEMGPFVPFNQQTSSATQPLSVNTYGGDAAKTLLPFTAASSYKNYPPPPSSMVPPSHFSVSTSTRSLSSSSDCGYSSGRESVSPHSLPSTALSPPVAEMECPASPKINVEDLDDDDAEIDLSSTPLNLVRRPTFVSNSNSLPSESVWRPF